MNLTVRLFILLFFCNTIACAQADITLTQNGLQVRVINEKYPLLKILLPGQSSSDRGIEVEFPEHVTGKNSQTNTIEHIYLVTAGRRNKRTMPAWKKEGDTLKYECVLNGNINMTAKAILASDGLAWEYTFTNNSNITWENLQAVTCVKLYSAFSDTLLERTYVHHADGFELVASETPERLTMPLNKWLPCRYLVSYTWPVSPVRMEKTADSITRYHKSRKTDRPMIATLSHDKKWVVATYTKETGNVWTNPERSCHHADPAVTLKPGETKTLWLKTLIIKGDLSSITIR